MKKTFFTLIILLLFYQLNSQNYINITAFNEIKNDTINFCKGEKVMLQSHITNFYYYDDFNSGIFNVNFWDSTYNDMEIGVKCYNAVLPATGQYAWVKAKYSRQLRTKPLNLISIYNLEWDMKYGNNNNISICESPDEANEGVYLQYSIDNGVSWYQFPGIERKPIGVFGSPDYINGSGGYWTPSNSTVNNSCYQWNHYQVFIPNEARTSQTIIRWIQTNHTNQNTDFWGLDNVKCYDVPQPNYSILWTNGSTQLIPPPFRADSSHWHKVMLTDYTITPPFISYDSIYINVKNINIPTATFTDSTTYDCSKFITKLHYTGTTTPNSNFYWSSSIPDAIIDINDTLNPVVYNFSDNSDSLNGNIYLTVYDSNKCMSDLYYKEYKIKNSYFGGFKTEPEILEGCSPLKASFITNGIVSPNLEMEWVFSNGIKVKTNNPILIFKEPGSWDLKLYYSDKNWGCKDSLELKNLIKVYEIPKAEIYMKDSVLYSIYKDWTYKYQWYYNNEEIMNYHQYFYKPEVIGYFNLQITSNYGCKSNMSETFLNIDKSEFYKKDNILNNPTHDFFSLKYNSIVNKVDILNINGITLKSYGSAHPFNTYYIDELNSGLYFVKVFIDNDVYLYKLIKY